MPAGILSNAPAKLSDRKSLTIAGLPAAKEMVPHHEHDKTQHILQTINQNRKMLLILAQLPIFFCGLRIFPYYIGQ